MSELRDFDQWIDDLQERVIQDEFGYQPGEFTVYPDLWRSLFDEGLSPREAWQRALDDHKSARDEEDRRRAENWKRIQAEDAIAIERYRSTLRALEAQEDGG